MNYLADTGTALFSALIAENGTKMSRARVIQRENERSNLRTITRLVLRSFLVTTMRENKRIIEGETPQLTDLIMMVEKVLWHGFRSPAQKSLLSLRTPDSELWSAIVRFSKSLESMKETVRCIEQMDSLTLPICKIRAFLRLSLMQKKLSDHFTHIAHSSLLGEYYEPEALLRQEDVVQLTGALLGLAVIDCNLSLEPDVLQDQPLSVDLAEYIKISTLPTFEEGQNEISPISSLYAKERKMLMDQTHYLEERNRQLEINLENMKKKVEVLEGQSKKENASVIMEQEMVSFRMLDDSLRKKDDNQDDVKSLLLQVTEQKDSLQLLQQQLNDTQKINADLYEKMRASEDAVRLLEKDAVRIREHHIQERNNLHRSLKQLETQANNLSEQLEAKSSNDHSLQKDYEKKCDQYADTIQLLEAKQAELAKVENELSTVRRQMDKYKTDALELPFIKEELNDLREKFNAMSLRAEEAEQLRVELGDQLSESRLKILELAEELMPLSDAEWAKDSEVHECTKCQEKFTLAKRKHHCRMCGHIFCDPCTTCRVRLPSNPKPVRVCDQCYTHLGSRPSKKT